MTDMPPSRRTWQHRTPRARLLLWTGWLALVALFVWCWQVMTQRTIWAFVWDAPTQAPTSAPDVPPRWSYMNELWLPLWDTLNMATLGTMLGVILAVPIAFLAARNTSPSVLILRPVALFVIVASRSINSLIWALLLVAILGPGAPRRDHRHRPAVDRLHRQAALRGDRGNRPQPDRGVTATGASPAQVLSYGIVPQVMPAFWGITVFRWDINIRESAILGLVGAGGWG
jgi:phosphonate transport system permease protein